MPNPSYCLARWFVEEFCGRTWDSRFDGQHLAQAKRLVNPKEGEPLDIDVIKLCLTKMRDGEWKWNKPITSLSAVTWLSSSGAPYYQLAVDYIATRPPIYEITSYDHWVQDCGRMAIHLGVWDGDYRGWENPLEKEFRLNPLQLSEVVG